MNDASDSIHVGFLMACRSSSTRTMGCSCCSSSSATLCTIDSTARPPAIRGTPARFHRSTGRSGRVRTRCSTTTPQGRYPSIRAPRTRTAGVELCPLGQKCGLAESGRGTDDREVSCAPHQRIGEPRPPHDFVRKPWLPHLRAEYEVADHTPPRLVGDLLARGSQPSSSRKDKVGLEGSQSGGSDRPGQ
jgi:hypothetical protein